MYVWKQSVGCLCENRTRRNGTECNYMGDWYNYDEGSGGEGGWAFPLPLARHHFAILSTAYRLLLPTPALTTPLTVWTVEGYLTMCLISLDGVNERGR